MALPSLSVHDACALTSVSRTQPVGPECGNIDFPSRIFTSEFLVDFMKAEKNCSYSHSGNYVRRFAWSEGRTRWGVSGGRLGVGEWGGREGVCDSSLSVNVYSCTLLLFKKRETTQQIK